MPELAPRLPCPVCLGVMMDKVRVGTDAPVEIDHCRRCGGVWLEHGEVQLLGRQPAAALWTAIARRPGGVTAACHDCHAPFARNLTACPACGWKNVIACPACDRPMERASRECVHLDACRGCRGAWFDHHELDAVWRVQASLFLQRRSPAGALVDTGGSGVDLPDLLWHAPDLVNAAAHGVSGIAHVAAHLPEAAAAAPEAAILVLEVAGEAAGGVFQVIVSILEGLFGAIDF